MTKDSAKPLDMQERDPAAWDAQMREPYPGMAPADSVRRVAETLARTERQPDGTYLTGNALAERVRELTARAETIVGVGIAGHPALELPAGDTFDSSLAMFEGSVASLSDAPTRTVSGIRDLAPITADPETGLVYCGETLILDVSDPGRKTSVRMADVFARISDIRSKARLDEEFAREHHPSSDWRIANARGRWEAADAILALFKDIRL